MLVLVRVAGVVRVGVEEETEMKMKMMVCALG